MEIISTENLLIFTILTVVIIFSLIYQFKVKLFNTIRLITIILCCLFIVFVSFLNVSEKGLFWIFPMMSWLISALLMLLTLKIQLKK